MYEKKIWIVAGVSVIVGLIIGFVYERSEGRYQYRDKFGGTHMMPDGKMMHNTMGMDDMMSSMNRALEGKTGDEFDKAFLSEMIVHHQGAVEMATLALKNANHKEIKDLATAIINAQNKEIGDMKSWQGKWFTK